MSKPLFPWLGGKRKLAKHILPLFPQHTCYVEPFCGGAALFFAKDESKVEVINDLDSDIVNLYRVTKHHLEELCKQFKWILCSREQFQWLKDTPPETLTDIQRAARFLYLQKMCFGGRNTGRTFGTATTAKPKFNLMSIEQDLSDAHMRLHRVFIEHLSWEKVIEKYDRPETLFYLDPPYWKTAGYGSPFGFDNYERMAELAKNIQGKMIISINDHSDMRQCFEGLKLKQIDYKYTAGKSNSKKASELVYCNF